MTGVHRTRRSLRAGAVAAAAVLVAGVGLAAFTAPASASSADDVLVSGETDSSDNMRLLTNLPKNGAFEPVGAFNSDLAFKGDYAFAGNYNGFTVYDITKPAQDQGGRRRCVCPGSQNDISVHGDLLFLSVDSRRTRRHLRQRHRQPPPSPLRATPGRASGSSTSATRPTREYVKAVRDRLRLAHPHPRAGRGRRDGLPLRLVVQPAATLPDCQPPHDAISIVEVPGGRPDHGRRVVADAGAVPGRRVSEPRTPAAATTSPPTPRRTSRPAPAWVTASSWTSATRTAPVVIDRVKDTRTSRSGTRRRSTTTAPR